MARMTGDRYFAEAIHGYGVSHVFFVPTIMLPSMAAMEDLDIRRVVTHGEKAAAYMADGYARASGRPGLCLAQAIGAANLAAGLRDAYMAGSPVIAITGGPEPDSRYRHVYQEVDDFPMFEPVTKANYQIDQVERLPDLLRQAFRTATAGTPGPVHLRVTGRHGSVLEAEADLELVVEEQFARCPPFRPEPEGAAVRQAARLLREAQRPVLVAGGGVAISGAAAELVALAEKLTIPVVTSLNGKGTIPDDHPLAVGVVGVYSRACANQVVGEADLVFFVGSPAGSHVTNNWKLPRPGTQVIQLDLNPEELGRSYPLAVGLLGDARVGVQRLVDAAEPLASRPEWTRRVHGLVREWRAEVAPRLTSDAVPIRPERICGEINASLPPDAIVVSDTGHSGMWTGALIELTRPGQRFVRCAGSLGWAFPAALGAKCAQPDRPVICFTGDGGFYYHLAELETAARFGINTVTVINNNHSLNQEEHLFDAAYGGKQRGRSHEMWVFVEANLAKVAEALGCVGIRVEHPSELRPALERALAADRPVVVDVATDIHAMAPRAWG